MAELFPNQQLDSNNNDTAATSNSSTTDRMDLTEIIDNSSCYARNVSNAHPLSNLFIGDSTLGCKSDSDEQLIIHIAFKEFVKIRFIKFMEYNNGMDPECNPSTVHLFVNRENLGFEDIDDIDPTQTLTLTPEQLKQDSEPIPLKFVKYQRVTSLTLYIEENQGGSITALGGLKLFGKSIETVDMKNFKAKPEPA